MRSTLERSNDRRFRECGTGSPACQYAPAPGNNPLGLCDGHLEEHHARCGVPAPPKCPACNPVGILIAGHLSFPVGGMCFACCLTTGGTPPSASHIVDARQKMTRRLAELFKSGDRGAEWVALLARCPVDIRDRIGVALAKSTAP